MFYRNTTKGARAIHLTNGTHKLVEPGCTVQVEPGKVSRLAPGLVECDDPSSEVPPVPDELAEAIEGGGESEKPEVSDRMKKDELLAIAEAEGVTIETDDNKADLIRKIEAARG